ncbi:MAG: HEPN domain-containing protein [Defluviitaleaceae bacterium]|nr:HEPN domain-containing protein [Defluviitaleaceae bacterium]MCL2264019.1 HEPN domain-containing protein [Defluviitaleaceae bacterium]
MAEIGSFLYIAQKDLERARLMHDVDDFNAAGRFCEQSVEKCLKSYIELKGDASDFRLMSLHKPRRLYERCIQLGMSPLPDRDVTVLSKLADYYYDTNYPGNYYFELTFEQSVEALVLTEKIYEMFESGKAYGK